MSKILFYISASSWKSDSRLRRFADIGRRAGYSTKVYAFTPTERSYDHDLTLSAAPVSSFANRVIDVLVMTACRVLPERAMLALLSRRNACREISQALLDTPIAPRSTVCAKHWVALPAALAACRKSRAHLWLDVNEVFESEHADRLLWRLIYPPVIRRLMNMAERQGALFTITSKAQITRTGPRASLYIPNSKVPASKPAQYIKGQPIRLLYHGLILPNRGLDIVLDALAVCDREDVLLKIRGYGKPALLSALQSQALSLGISHRVTFEGGVENARVVEAATESDVGISIFSSTTEQILCSEPNKLYEYLAAGLAIIATRTPGMETILGSDDFGRQIPFDETQTEQLTRVFSELDGEAVRAWQGRARLFAQKQLSQIEEKDAELARALCDLHPPV